MIDHDTGRCVSLNHTAAAVLELCDGSHTVESIASELAAIFEVEQAAVARDVEQLLDQLRAHQLLTTAQATD